MKSNIKIILTAILALLIGLLAGYFLFDQPQQMASTTENHQPEATNSAPQIWTCSMHPQIRQNEPGICPLCEMDLIPLETTSNGTGDPLVLEMTEASVQLANIQTTIIGGSTTPSDKGLSLTGKVKADERLASSEVAHVPGRIEKLFVTFTGEQVTKGQKLATIYAPELITAQRELLEALKLQSLHPGLLEAARNKLRFWKIEEAVIEAIEQQGTIQETFTLLASESGIVTKRYVALGDYLKKGEPLFELMNLRKVWVLFDAYEEDLPGISIGDALEFTTPSIPNKSFKTRITFIDPLLDPLTRTVALRAEVSNPNGLLKPEMLVNGMLLNKVSGKQQLTVPMSAVLWTGTRSVAYVKIPDRDIPSFQFREVELGADRGDAYLVVSGLKAGDEVVTNGSFSIDAAAQLNNQASMMNRNIQVKTANMEEAKVPDFSTLVPVAFQKQLHDLVAEYLVLKDAFVATDAAAAAVAAQKLVVQLEQTDAGILQGAQQDYWIQHSKALLVHGQKIATISEVEEQRRQFHFLSEVLIQTIEAFGVSGEVLYLQHCPMAFGNQGADWISVQKEIQNPYFGDKMMKCGTVKKTFDLSQN